MTPVREGSEYSTDMQGSRHIAKNFYWSYDEYCWRALLCVLMMPVDTHISGQCICSYQ